MEKLISIRYGKFVNVYRGWFEVRLVDLLVGGPLQEEEGLSRVN